MTILLDNTVLSNFASIQHPELIPMAFAEEVAATDQVFEELEAGVKAGRLPDCDLSWLKTIVLRDDETSHFLQLAQNLGKGEASCLAAAFSRRYKVATDDKDARQWAMRLDIPHTGTIGILAELVRRKAILLSVGNRFLKQMVDRGYFSPIVSLDEL
jgi:predicted nucleic acid-binding protein